MKFFSPLISILNTWTDSLHNNLHRLDVLVLNLQPEKATFDDVLKLLTEHAKDLKELGLFNKQFSQTFVLYFFNILSFVYLTLLIFRNNFLKKSTQEFSLRGIHSSNC